MAARRERDAGRARGGGCGVERGRERAFDPNRATSGIEAGAPENESESPFRIHRQRAGSAGARAHARFTASRTFWAPTESTGPIGPRPRTGPPPKGRPTTLTTNSPRSRAALAGLVHREESSPPSRTRPAGGSGTRPASLPGVASSTRDELRPATWASCAPTGRGAASRTPASPSPETRAASRAARDGRTKASIGTRAPPRRPPRARCRRQPGTPRTPGAPRRPAPRRACLHRRHRQPHQPSGTAPGAGPRSALVKKCTETLFTAGCGCGLHGNQFRMCAPWES